MTKGTLRTLTTGSFIVKFAPFFFIGGRDQFLHFFVAWFRLFDVFFTRNHFLAFIARIVEILFGA